MKLCSLYEERAYACFTFMNWGNSLSKRINTTDEWHQKTDQKYPLSLQKKCSLLKLFHRLTVLFVIFMDQVIGILVHVCTLNLLNDWSRIRCSVWIWESWFSEPWLLLFRFIIIYYFVSNKRLTTEFIEHQFIFVTPGLWVLGIV